MSEPQPTAVSYAFVSDGKTYFINHPSLAAHYSLAGQIAAAHAHIELTLDAVIWEMSNSAGSSGAAITAQMLGLRPRINAITSILAWLDPAGGAAIIKTANRFSEDARAHTNARNRAVHDVWFWSEQDDDAYQFRAEAEGKRLGFGLELRSITRLQEQYQRIDELRIRCIALKNEILAWYRALPEGQRARAQPFRA